MAADGIFLINGDLESGDAKLFEMKEQPYISERTLQDLLERYPNLLAGGQIDPDVPRRWLLVRREQPVADAAASAGRWSLDHLFVDQDGIPTLVEVKRATDTRIRREVVGQMMDYAANGVVYWPVEQIRAEFETRHPDSDEAVRTALGADVDPMLLWDRVTENLASGRVRLLFVADEIPRELKRIVEFLNEQMKAEVLAIAVKQHLAEGVGARTMTATVYGATERSRDSKSSGPRLPGREWDLSSFNQAIAESFPALSQVVDAVLAWANGQDLGIEMGKGRVIGTVNLWASRKGQYLFALRTDGKIELGFGYLKSHPAFATHDDRYALASKLNALDQVHLASETADKWPSIPMSCLIAPTQRSQFLGAMDWAIAKIRAAP